MEMLMGCLAFHRNVWKIYRSRCSATHVTDGNSSYHHRTGASGDEEWPCPSQRLWFYSEWIASTASGVLYPTRSTFCVPRLPPKLRSRVLTSLHEGHLGVVTVIWKVLRGVMCGGLAWMDTTRTSTHPHTGMACHPLAMHTRRLCWSVFGSHVSYCGRRPLKVAWNLHS